MKTVTWNRTLLITLLMACAVCSCTTYPPYQPCERTRNAMASADELIAWSTDGGRGAQSKGADARVQEINGRLDYRCSAHAAGSSRTINGRTFSDHRRSWQR